MSGRVNSRNGSALLIVLGMLSFMVISAVAFSMFMRENRLPSSFLRQKLVANHLVKAALANAMNEIDAAIGSNPYPGVIASGGMSRNGSVSLEGLSNEWENRVFVGKETDGYLRVGGDADATVPTLTLESLAYLPPPLINTVRYMSRHTPTALWSQLKYDAGRYAYTAVNVSDYLDINRMHADVMRDSSPSNRVSITYLFENEDHTGPASGASPAKFDDFIKKAREDGDYKSRLVSLADYNLAIGSSKSGTSKYGDIGFKSPFLEYIASEGEGLFYAGVANVMDTVKRQQFVTDSWYPGISTNSLIYLSDDNAQPFDGNETFYSITKGSGNGSDTFKILRSQMDGATLGALCDYVDEDSVPISLAIPTIERTPMLTGIYVMPKQNNFRLTLKTTDEELEPANQQNGTTAKKRRTWTIDSIGDGKLLCDAHGVYPFKRTSGRTESKDYKAEILVKAFFSEMDFDFEKTRLTALSLKPKNKNEWKSEYAISDSQKAYMTEVAQGTVTFKDADNRIKEEDCEVSINFNSGVVFKGSELADIGIYGLTFREGEEANGAYDPAGIGGTGKKGPLYYYTSTGGRKAITENGANLDIQLKLNFAVYVRILDGKGNTVDLVPAMLADDNIYNGLKSQDDAPSAFVDGLCGSLEPVLPITSSTPILNVNLETFRNCAVSKQATPTIEDPTYDQIIKIFCDDPRFNFAPEDWYAPSGDFSWSEWLSAVQARCSAKEDDYRQNDIFQFVSDCGFLQSMGELQFLPNLGGFFGKNGGSPNGTAYYRSSKYNDGKNKPFSERTSAASTANHQYGWCTHWAFGKDADWVDGSDYSPYNWGIADARDGAVVTPYSTSDELLMAGLANTPYDWAVAGLASEGEFKADDVGQFCFNGYDNSEAPLDWTDLKKIADKLRSCFANGQGWDNDLSASASENDQWNSLWSQKGKILGVPVDDVHDVDRKFLYSYWKGCFGDRQQLFLIFVRAEPTSMGAGVGKKLLRSPAQLGARAVALVWREPVSSIASGASDSVAPHRMRILFYHQFE